jgi:hypothetical protein
MHFVCISAIISLCVINLLDFKTVVEIVYCAVRSECLNIFQVIHAL